LAWSEGERSDVTKKAWHPVCHFTLPFQINDLSVARAAWL
jgi:hypothetical protein